MSTQFIYIYIYTLVRRRSGQEIHLWLQDISTNIYVVSVYVSVHKYIYIYVCLYTFIYVCIFICIYIYIYVYICEEASFSPCMCRYKCRSFIVCTIHWRIVCIASARICPRSYAGSSGGKSYAYIYLDII